MPRRKNKCLFFLMDVKPRCVAQEAEDECLYWEAPNPNEIASCKFDGPFDTCTHKVACAEAAQKLYKHLRQTYGEEQ